MPHAQPPLSIFCRSKFEAWETEHSKPQSSKRNVPSPGALPSEDNRGSARGEITAFARPQKFLSVRPKSHAAARKAQVPSIFPGRISGRDLSCMGARL